ncbi:MAG: NAD(P)H-dependent oxidoreductase [Deltaproteobacteria bacterium]|jgi:glutathione-regulated potassium-efflux system ancillary protein KefG|nr:NAD(P)H-dependent oxidoreductase [Deltaproteobacteria bacterium]
MSTGRRILVLLAHPALERSRVIRRLAETAAATPGVTLHDLYEAYPSLAIDVRREQGLLLGHDVFVFLHPLYWYSTPAILKEWQDLVLEHGWAYGSHGHQLDGKVTCNVLSTGGPAQAYRPGGSNRYTLRQLLAPWDQTAHLCRMRYLAPFAVHGALGLETEADLAPHQAQLRGLLEALRDDRLDLELAARAESMTPLEPLLKASGAAT